MNNDNSIEKKKVLDIVVDVLDFDELDHIVGGASEKKGQQVGCFAVLSGGCKSQNESQN